VTFDRGATPPSQQPEPFIEQARNIGRAERHGPGGGELDREWDPIETTTDLADHGSRRRIENEVGSHRPRPIREQLDRVAVPDQRAMLGRLGVQGPQRPHLLPDHPETLPAGREEAHLTAALHHRVNEAPHVEQQMLAVVHHQQQILGGEELGDALRQRQPLARHYPERGRDQTEHRVGIACRRELAHPPPDASCPPHPFR
jgi:hypothetical protein